MERLCGGRSTSLAREVQSAKVSHAQLTDRPLRSDTQVLRFIVSIPLIQRRDKHRSREEKSAFTWWFSLSMYVVLKTRYVNLNIHVRRY